MAEDFLTDDEQLEAVKRWTAENGLWLLAGVVLGAAILFGWRLYDSHRNGQALDAAARFGEMTGALEKNDPAGARRIAADITRQYSGTPYADQAELMVARLDVDDGRFADAAAPLTRVMNDSKDAQLRNIARLRLARLLTDQGKPDEAIGLLAGGEPGAFAARYHEVRGDALFVKKDFGGAVREYQSALAASDPRGADTALLELKISDLATATKEPNSTAAIPAGLPSTKPSQGTPAATPKAPATATTVTMPNAPAAATAPSPPSNQGAP